MNIPYIKDVGAKTFLYTELIFYPTVKDQINSYKDIINNTRFSGGFGVSIPLGMTSILIYFNAININTKKGIDFEK